MIVCYYILDLSMYHHISLNPILVGIVYSHSRPEGNMTELNVLVHTIKIRSVLE